MKTRFITFSSHEGKREVVIAVELDEKTIVAAITGTEHPSIESERCCLHRARYEQDRNKLVVNCRKHGASSFVDNKELKEGITLGEN